MACERKTTRLVTRGGFCLSALAVSLSGLLWAATTPGRTEIPVCEFEIVFDRDRDGGRQIYVLDIETKRVRQLTRSAGPDEFNGFPDWSPDGRRIAFASNRDSGSRSLDLYAMDADGGSLTRLTDSPELEYSPAWSPQGDEIAFVSVTNDIAGINIIRIDGSGLRRIGPTPAYGPSWSPDAAWIAFVSGEPNRWDIYVMRADGTEVHQLTHTEANEGSVQWSPDGEHLAFDAELRTNFDLYVMRADGSEMRRLTQGEAVDARPEWSPDANRLVFHTNRDGGSVGGSEVREEFELYLMDLSDGAVTRLTTNEEPDAHPDWCPA